MKYREQAATPDVAHLVLSYWEFTVTGGDRPLVHEVFADGCVSLLYHRNTGRDVSRLELVGARVDSLRAEVFPGDIYWGARLSPAAGRGILRCDPATVRSRIVDLSRLMPQFATELTPILHVARSFTEAVAAYHAGLSSLRLSRDDVDTVVAAAVRAIERSEGQARITNVATNVGISVRQLERRFRSNVGMTPKQFARTRRVRATAVGLVARREINWATRAFETGFSDQSHLTREFVAVTGRSPASFAEDVTRIEHGKLVT